MIAGLLSIAGIFWATRLLAFFVSPIATLVVLPGYLIWGLWIWRAWFSESKPVFLIAWIFSMVWHLAIALTAPLISGLMHDAPFVRAYAVLALLLSLIGFLTEIRLQNSMTGIVPDSTQSEQAVDGNPH